MKFYTGVGDHRLYVTPIDKLNEAMSLSRILEIEGFHLRTGDATGFDDAFTKGVSDPSNVTIYDRKTNERVNKASWNKSVEIALRNHPKPELAMPYINLIGRNPFQVLGDNLDDPSLFLVGWTNGGRLVGGTGTTMRVAKEFKVPVYNLFRKGWKDILADIRKRF